MYCDNKATPPQMPEIAQKVLLVLSCLLQSIPKGYIL